MQADILDEWSWESLRGNRFQVAVSDALHQPYALLHEFGVLRRYALLDLDRLFILWGDLDRVRAAR